MSTKKAARVSKIGMEENKATGEQGGKSPFSPSGIRQFFLEVQSEFRKIVWPGKKPTAGLTGFVILLVVVISLYLGSVDLLLGKLVSTVLK
ncbi:preprotein translocase subunit SecE [Desulfobulbus sp.]|uniref:preprotein translocase subunit SecE n=1 Tax=Desulfobulbus sp. TaxID=895 RepID=UPI0027B9B10C|nr:preprotein translocase subunit SecE [Desulfobulbus sp.]